MVNIILGAIIIAIVILALKHVRKSKGCDCGCSSCGNSCDMDKK